MTVRKGVVCVLNCDMCMILNVIPTLATQTTDLHMSECTLWSCAPNTMSLQRVTPDRRKWREAKTSCTKARHERELTMPQDHCGTELRGSQGQEVIELLWSAREMTFL